jgi:hypothetical protein
MTGSGHTLALILIAGYLLAMVVFAVAEAMWGCASGLRAPNGQCVSDSTLDNVEPLSCAPSLYRFKPKACAP